MAGKREGVADVVRRIVDRRRAGKADTENDKGAEQDRHQRRKRRSQRCCRGVKNRRMEHRRAQLPEDASVTLAEIAVRPQPDRSESLFGRDSLRLLAKLCSGSHGALVMRHPAPCRLRIASPAHRQNRYGEAGDGDLQPRGPGFGDRAI